MENRIKRRRLIVFFISGIILCLPGSFLYARVPEGDRAMEITMQVKDEVGRSGKQLIADTKSFFKNFASQTKELQNIIDTKKALENAGLMDNETVKANINSRFLFAVGELKEYCDKHLSPMLESLENFEKTIARAVVNTQDVKAINSNYELILEQYRRKENKKYNRVETEAKREIEECNRGNIHSCSRYQRLKDHLNRIGQNVKMLEARARIAEINQELSGAIRETIKEKGPSIAGKFRQTIDKLYGVFQKIAHVVAIGGTDILRNLLSESFGLPFGEMEETLEVMLASVEKLDKEIDSIVDGILKSLGCIESPTVGDELKGSQLNVEQEMESLRKLRERAFQTK